MKRRKWLWAVVLVLPLVVGGGLVYANTQSQTYTCPITGEQLPCPECCPLNDAKSQAPKQPYICPVTGEELACPRCCPLNKRKPAEPAN